MFYLLSIKEGIGSRTCNDTEIQKRSTAGYWMGEEDPSEGITESIKELFSSVDLWAVGTHD